MYSVSEVRLTEEQTEDYIEWVSLLQFQTVSLSVVINNTPLLMPLESFRWADRQSEPQRSSRPSLRLLRLGTPEPQQPLSPASTTTRSASGTRLFRSFPRLLKKLRR